MPETTSGPQTVSSVDVEALLARVRGSHDPPKLWYPLGESEVLAVLMLAQRLRAELALKDEVIRAARRVDGCFWAFADTVVHQGEMGCLPALDSALDRLDAAPGSPAESSQ